MHDLTNHISREHAVSLAAQTPARPPASPPHQCHTCHKSFSTLVGLAAHRQAKQHYFACSVCNRMFKTPELLEGHTSDAHSPPTSPPRTEARPSSPPAGPSTDRRSAGPRCNQCGGSFNSYADLENHIGSSHKFPCSKCDQRFPSLLDWNNHFMTQHKFQCGACKTSFSSNVALASHGNLCPAVVSVRPTSSQPVHFEAPLSGQQSKFSCNYCGKTFKSDDGLQSHVATKHPSVNCGICQFKGTATAALEVHINKVHCCAICQDNILRDAKTLEDHMYEHTHPYLCKKCGTKYRSEADLSTHFASADNYHPVCTECHIGFEDETRLRSHVCSAHPPSRRPSPRKRFVCSNCPELFASQIALEAHFAEKHSPIFRCHICGESYSAQSALSSHIATDHSCHICHDGVYLDAKSLEEHLEDHRAPYRCEPCGTRYSEEGLLLQHYKNTSDDIHPGCVRCDMGFENDDAYEIHISDVHRPTPCEPCGGLVLDERDLPAHYVSSRNHPVCTKCDVGFKDSFEFADHGALEHPESHCYLCRWQFDSPEVLNNHIKHFVNHPKCADCDLRFPDAGAYQHHLFSVHFPNADHKTALAPATQVHLQPEESRVSPFSSPTQRNQVFDGKFALEGNETSPFQPSSVPLPPSISGFSSPASQRVSPDASLQRESQTQSCSPMLSLDRLRASDPRRLIHQSLNVDTTSHTNGYPDFDHSPLSTVPAVGTPLVARTQSGQSFDFRTLFSPRRDGTRCFTPRGVNGGIDRSVHFIGEEDSDISSFTRSPQLISPAVKLPSPVARSPTGSDWTSNSGSVTKLSLDSCVSSSPIVKVVSGSEESGSLGRSTPDFTLRVSDAGNIGVGAATASPISPESAGISVSAVTQTPEYLRDARAYLPLTHQTVRSSSPPVPHSPTNSSPILSSTGLAVGERGRRREVRFDDNIMSEPVWNREPTSSDASLDDPAPCRKPNGIHTKEYGASRLPRFTSLKRRRFANGRPNHLAHVSYGRALNQSSTSPYHCRICLKDSCEDLTTTMCGHLFCYECISSAIMDDPHCPVCNAPTLLYCLFCIDLSR